MKRSDHPRAEVTTAATLQADALVICPACGARVETVQAWAIPKPPRLDLSCQRWEPDELWYEMGPCGCEVDSFIWRTGVVEAGAREMTGYQLPAPRRELAP